MSEESGLNSYVAGLKQSLKMLRAGKAAKVYLASDADFYISAKISEECGQTGTELEVSFSKSELGRICKIEVDAAVVTILK